MMKQANKIYSALRSHNSISNHASRMADNAKQIEAQLRDSSQVGHMYDKNLGVSKIHEQPLKGQELNLVEGPFRVDTQVNQAMIGRHILESKTQESNVQHIVMQQNLMYQQQIKDNAQKSGTAGREQVQIEPAALNAKKAWCISYVIRTMMLGPNPYAVWGWGRPQNDKDPIQAQQEDVWSKKILNPAVYQLLCGSGESVEAQNNQGKQRAFNSSSENSYKNKQRGEHEKDGAGKESARLYDLFHTIFILVAVTPYYCLSFYVYQRSTTKYKRISNMQDEPKYMQDEPKYMQDKPKYMQDKPKYMHRRM